MGKTDLKLLFIWRRFTADMIKDKQNKTALAAYDYYTARAGNPF